MTPEEWCKLAKQIVQDGGIFQCIISGGEPLLLGDSLFDIMDILHDDGTSFVVITNGFLLTKEKVLRFKKYRFYWFQISIDGVNSDIHDSFRGVDGSWNHAVNGALEVSNAGLPLVIAHSVTPKNLNSLEEMTQLAYQLGANSIILGEVLPSGRAIFNPDIMLTQEQKQYLYQKIHELSIKFQGKLVIKRSASIQTQMQRYALDANGGGIIRPNGDFRLDCMAPFVIGNVLKKPLKDIWKEKGEFAWQSPQVENFINSINKYTQSGNRKNHVEPDILL